MEKEVSMVVEIGVALIALSAFIGILWFTVFMGKDMSNSASIETSEMLGTVQQGTLEELSGNTTELPTSAVYSLLRSNYNIIGEVSCDVTPECKGDKTGKCLLSHLNGKVNLDVELVDGGSYKLIIHKLH